MNTFRALYKLEGFYPPGAFAVPSAYLDVIQATDLQYIRSYFTFEKNEYVTFFPRDIAQIKLFQFS